MIVRKYDDYLLIKVFNENIKEFDVFDIDSIKLFFKYLFCKLKNKYQLKGLMDANVYVDNNYGMIIELKTIDSYFNDIDIRLKIHFNECFLTEINVNDILDYRDVYYYKGKFYGTYFGIIDSEVLYKDTEEIINKGIKVC